MLVTIIALVLHKKLFVFSFTLTPFRSAYVSAKTVVATTLIKEVFVGLVRKREYKDSDTDKSFVRKGESD